MGVSPTSHILLHNHLMRIPAHFRHQLEVSPQILLSGIVATLQRFLQHASIRLRVRLQYLIRFIVLLKNPIIISGCELIVILNLILIFNFNYVIVGPDLPFSGVGDIVIVLSEHG